MPVRVPPKTSGRHGSFNGNAQNSSQTHSRWLDGRVYKVITTVVIMPHDDRAYSPRSACTHFGPRCGKEFLQQAHLHAKRMRLQIFRSIGVKTWATATDKEKVTGNKTNYAFRLLPANPATDTGRTYTGRFVTVYLTLKLQTVVLFLGETW